MIGALGLPLLDWLERSALPEEARLAEPGYAAAVATEFLSGLTAAGTTTALVFGAHFARRSTRCSARPPRWGCASPRPGGQRPVAAPGPAHHTSGGVRRRAGPGRRWHGVGRSRYAVTPRFSLSCSDAMLDSCAALMQAVDGACSPRTSTRTSPRWLRSARCSTTVPTTSSSYHRHGLVDRRSVFAHNVHPTTARAGGAGGAGRAVAHCPTSNAALGSGLFPLRDHVEHGVRVALGSDVGAGTGFSLLKEGLQAYFMQQLLGRAGAAADAGAPPAPRHVRRRRGPRAGRRGRRLLGGQAVRRGLAATRARVGARRGPAPRRRRVRRAGQGVRAGHVGRHRRRCSSRARRSDQRSTASAGPVDFRHAEPS